MIGLVSKKDVENANGGWVDYEGETYIVFREPMGADWLHSGPDFFLGYAVKKKDYDNYPDKNNEAVTKLDLPVYAIEWDCIEEVLDENGNIRKDYDENGNIIGGVLEEDCCDWDNPRSVTLED